MVATPLIVLYVRKAALKAAEAAGITVEEKQLRQLDLAASNAVMGVEEYVRGAAQSGLKLQSNEKLDQAVKIAREMAKDGLQAWTDDQIRLTAEAKLPEMRARLSSAPPAAVPVAITGSLPPPAPELAQYTRHR
jgi:hypothetical protein